MVFFVFIIIALCFYTSYHKTLVQERAQVQIKIMESREKKKQDNSAAKDAFERVIAQTKEMQLMNQELMNLRMQQYGQTSEERR